MIILTRVVVYAAASLYWFLAKRWRGWTGKRGVRPRTKRVKTICVHLIYIILSYARCPSPLTILQKAKKSSTSKYCLLQTTFTTMMAAMPYFIRVSINNIVGCWGLRGPYYDRKCFKPPKNFDNFISLRSHLITPSPLTLPALIPYSVYLQRTELKLLSVHLTTTIIEKIFSSMLYGNPFSWFKPSPLSPTCLKAAPRQIPACQTFSNLKLAA